MGIKFSKDNKILILTLTVFLFLIQLEVKAQSQLFKKYSVEEGLPFAQVNTIYQDEKGFIWAGGYGGLSKFDGYEFENFGKKDGLVNSYVTSIHGDVSGQIWVGTLDGLNLIKNGKLVEFKWNDYLPSPNVTCLASYNDKVLIGTISGLSIFSEGKLKTIQNNIKVNCLSYSRSELLIGTDQGLFRLDAANKLVEYNSSLEPEIKINAVFEDRNGDLFVGSDKGLFKINSFGVVFKYGLNQGLLETNIVAIQQQNEGHIWVGTSNFGLFKFDGNRFEHFIVGNHPYSNIISVLYKDYEGLLWVGSSFGMYKSVGNAFKHYTYKDGFPGRYIYQITRGTNGDLWVATDERGAFKYNGKSFSTYNTFFGLAGNSVKSILEFDSKYYFGTNKGLTILSGDTFKTISKNEGMFNHEILSLTPSQDSTIWMGVSGGVVSCKNDSIVNYQSAFPDLAQVWSIKEDSRGDLWVGAYLGGIYKYSKGDFIHMNSELGIEENNCLAIHEDYKGNLWFGTFDGIYRYDVVSKEILHINTEDGLSSDLVYSFVEEKQYPYLWVGTNQGINRIDLKKLYKDNDPAIVQYGIDDGFVGVECNCHGAFLDENDDIWFGTVNGLIKYDPKEKRKELGGVESKTHISGVKIFYEDTVLIDSSSLPYESNHLTFSYKGVCHINPNKVKYKFRLIGFDKDWSPASVERQTTYSNLPPGEYSFQVISSNSEGMWNNTPATFSFSIERPYYLRWWFFLLTGSILFVIVYGMLKFRIDRVAFRKDLERKMDNLKLQALRSQMNPHFIFNSLNSIQHYINSNEKREANLYLSKFAQLMRNILDNSRKPKVSIHNDIKGVELYIQMEQMRFEGRFDYEINMDDEIDPYEDEVPPMLLQPFVENSIIHGFKGLKRKGLISIDISFEEDYVKYEITDNGVGRDAAEKSKSKRASRLHESAAMGITKARIDTLSQYYRDDLKISIIDLRDENGNAAGTSVAILIPHD